MIKIYTPNNSNTSIGGGFSFLRNIKKALKDDIEFVDTWQECDIVFIFSITTIDKGEIHEAVENGKKLVLRVDNIPRRSRNKRQSPAERLEEFGKLADMVIYQSHWAMSYAGYFAGEGIVILNGVDTDIFNTKGRESDSKTYLYVNYNDNPNKRFDEALYIFDMDWRLDNEIKLLIAGNVPRIYLENPEYHWDIPTNGLIDYVGVKNTPEEMAELYKSCDVLLYPSFAEACPNVVAEAMACGCRVIGINAEGGTSELVEKNIGKGIDDRQVVISHTIKQMGEEYLKVFKKLTAG